MKSVPILNHTLILTLLEASPKECFRPLLTLGFEAGLMMFLCVSLVGEPLTECPVSPLWSLVVEGSGCRIVAV